MQIKGKVIAKVERDLRGYPDWIVRLQAQGLGIPSSPINAGLRGGSSCVEMGYDIEEEIRCKVFVIESVYDRLSPTAKELVEQRYYRDYSRDDVMKNLGISKHRFYYLRGVAIESFARGLGYIV